MTRFPVADCSACHAPILWAVTQKSGTPQPLDYEPNPEGNIVLVPGETVTLRGAVAPMCRVVTKLDRETGLFDTDAPAIYMPHHATCPDAARFRR
jgi:hypothetical protein